MELPTTHTVVNLRGWGEGGEGGGGRIPGRMGGGLLCCRRLLCSGGLLWGWQLGTLWLPGWDLLLRWGRQCAAAAASLVLPTSEHGASRRASKRFPVEMFGQVLLWSVTGVRVPLSTTPGKLMVSMSLISSLFCFSALANFDLRIPLSDFNCWISKLRTESVHWNAFICEVSSVIWTANFDILTGIVRHVSQLHTPVYSVSSPQHTVWYHAMHTEHRIILDAVGARQLGLQRKVVRFLVFLVGVPFRDVFLLFFLAADFVLRETLFETPPAFDSDGTASPVRSAHSAFDDMGCVCTDEDGVIGLSSQLTSREADWDGGDISSVLGACCCPGELTRSGWDWVRARTVSGVHKPSVGADIWCASPGSMEGVTTWWRSAAGTSGMRSQL